MPILKPSFVQIKTGFWQRRSVVLLSTLFGALATLGPASNADANGQANALASAVTANLTSTPYVARPDVNRYISEAASLTGYQKSELIVLFSQVERQEKVLERISRPAEKRLSWKEYRPIFITNKRIEGGKAFKQKHAKLLEAAEIAFGVPAEIITAIIGVETAYGRITGRDNAFASLVTLAFDYPPRAKFFRSELTEFLHLTREENLDPLTVTGSYAAAMGMPQFISSSYRHYALDFDGDGKRDLWNSTADVIGSVANYFDRHGWVSGDPIAERVKPSGKQYRQLLRKQLKPEFKAQQLADHGVRIRGSSQRKKSVMQFKAAGGNEVWVGYQNFYVITRYNHSALYAMAVYELSQALK